MTFSTGIALQWCYSLKQTVQRFWEGDLPNDGATSTAALPVGKVPVYAGRCKAAQLYDWLQWPIPRQTMCSPTP
eukprot:1924438-Pleurochrysis_carterae.AAC.5